MTNGLNPYQDDLEKQCWRLDCDYNYKGFCECRSVSKARYCKDFEGRDITK